MTDKEKEIIEFLKQPSIDPAMWQAIDQLALRHEEESHRHGLVSNLQRAAQPKHSPEPWNLKAQDYTEGVYTDTAQDDIIGEFWESRNAERAVACVNACQGISTEALKAGVLAKVFGACCAARDYFRTTPPGEPPIHAIEQALRDLVLPGSRGK